MNGRFSVQAGLRHTPPVIGADGVHAARFWAKVRKPAAGEGCWFWVGGIADNGYGQFALGHRDIHAAHRLSLAAHLRADLPGDVWALHGCDEPSCVNPAHLRPGTPMDNRADTIERHRTPAAGAVDLRRPRGRAVAIRDACRGSRTYDPDVIAQVLADGEPLRLF